MTGGDCLKLGMVATDEMSTSPSGSLSVETKEKCNKKNFPLIQGPPGSYLETIAV